MKMSFVKFMLMMALMKLPKVIDAETTKTTVTFFKPSTRPTTTTTTTTTTTSTTEALGCTDKQACNYDEKAEADDESCQYKASPNHDCDGTCKVKIDDCGICGGKGTGKDLTKCAKAKFRDDDYCDDGNNNCACGTKGDLHVT